jgi:YD repeat-containing protein
MSLFAACVDDTPTSASLVGDPASQGVADSSACPDADAETGPRASLCNGNNAVPLLGGLRWNSVERARPNPVQESFRWSAGLGVRLGLPHLEVGRHVTLVDEEGARFMYVALPEGGLRQPPDGPGRLVRNPDGTHVLTVPGGGTMEFGTASGDLRLLSRQTSIDGGRIELRHGRDGRPLTASGAGTTIHWRWEGDLLRAIESSAGSQKLELVHDAERRLVEVRATRGGTLRSRLTLRWRPLTDATSVLAETRLEETGEGTETTTAMRYLYTPRGRLAGVVGPTERDELAFERGPGAGGRGIVTVRVGTGGPIVETRTFDRDGRLREVRTPDEPTVRYEHDARGYLSRVITSDGQATALFHDPATGVLLRIQRTQEGEVASETRFEHRDQILASAITMMADGTTIASRYDETTGALRETVRGGFMTQYDASGRPVRETYRGQDIRRWDYESDRIVEHDLQHGVPRLTARPTEG